MPLPFKRTTFPALFPATQPEPPFKPAYFTKPHSSLNPLFSERSLNVFRRELEASLGGANGGGVSAGGGGKTSGLRGAFGKAKKAAVAVTVVEMGVLGVGALTHLYREARDVHEKAKEKGEAISLAEMVEKGAKSTGEALLQKLDFGSDAKTAKVLEKLEKDVDDIKKVLGGFASTLGEMSQLLTAIDQKIVVPKVAEEPKAAKVVEEPKAAKGSV